MFGISYIKADPTTHIIHYSNGKIVRQGPGLSFYFWRPSASIVAVPTASFDVPFIYNEVTRDFQKVALQGQISYRVADPVKVARNFNYTLVGSGPRYVSDDPEKLAVRIVNICQVLARPEVQKLSLKEALISMQPIMSAVLVSLKNHAPFLDLGIEVFGFNLLALSPTPEMSKAIEAEAREELQQRADEAISERRNSAVEQERRIKENELKTEMIVKTREQEIAKSALEATIALEKQRESLVAFKIENTKKEADAESYALAAQLRPLAALDPKVLQTLTASRMDPRIAVAQALRDIAQDASKIGQLNISPDLLTALMQPPAQPPAREIVAMYEKIVLVTRKTRLEALLQRFNTHSQAKFYIERSGSDFADYEREHEKYHASLKEVRAGIDGLAKLHAIERGFLPNFLFTEKDMVVTVGQDGLVVNTAKYLNGQPIVAINPDPARFDGVLLPFLPPQAAQAVKNVLARRSQFKTITMAEAALSDGQKLLAFNDLFIGRRGHSSSFYTIAFGGRQEVHSSSGIIVSTGAGSSGWLSSLYNMARGIAAASQPPDQLQHVQPNTRIAWDAELLRFVVREPFISKWSQAGIVLGDITPGQPLILESRTPEEGVIFSDGVEADFLQFNSGARATIQISERKTLLAV